MIEAGLSVVTALVILEQQTDDEALASVIDDVREQVETGALLSEAMAQHPDVFSRLYIAMVEAGEAAGVLDTVLDRVAIQIEKEQKIKRRVKGAMIYPSVVLMFATLVMTGMLMFLVPIFVKIFDQLGGELPMLTQIRAARVERAARPLVPGHPDSRRRLLRGRSDRRLLLVPALEEDRRAAAQKWDTFKLRMPMQIGGVVRKVAMARWSRTLSTLIASGVDIMRALEITAQTAGNWVVENETDRLRAPRRGGRVDRPAADRERCLPADDRADGEDRRGDR